MPVFLYMSVVTEFETSIILPSHSGQLFLL